MKSLSLSLLEIGEYFFKFLFLFSIGLFCLSSSTVSIATKPMRAVEKIKGAKKIQGMIEANNAGI